jgi:hypothetical protein
MDFTAHGRNAREWIRASFESGAKVPDDRAVHLSKAFIEIMETDAGM